MSLTTFFYAPPENFEDTVVHLPEKESHHASRVLRLRAGDMIEVVDGCGGWHKVRIERSDARKVSGSVVDKRLGVGESLFDLRLGVAAIKSRSRLDTAIEKAVELGVRHISVLKCQNSEAAKVDLDRCRRVARAAMKQSLRSILPKVEGTVPLVEFLKATNASSALICESGQGLPAIGTLASEIVQAHDCVVLVGPEGGFSPGEVELAEEARFRQVSLGNRRLRSETAAIVACAAIMLAVDETRYEIRTSGGRPCNATPRKS